MTGRDGPESTLEVPTVTEGRRGSRKETAKGRRKRKTANWREGKIERGYSPDTSLVRGVRALHMGRWFEPQKCGRVYEIADGS